jgi:hypothetical protein
MEAQAEGIMMDRPQTPFPRHWLYYMSLKFVVIAAAIVLAIYLFGFLF